MNLQNKIYTALVELHFPQSVKKEKLKNSATLLAEFYTHLIDDWFAPFNFYKYKGQHGYFDLCDELEQLGVLKKVNKSGKWYFKKSL